jgi:hypothetical protein
VLNGSRHSTGVIILHIDNRVRIDDFDGQLSDEVRDEIKRQFTYSNPDYSKAKAFGFFKHVPKFLVSWKESTDRSVGCELSVPRGGLSRVEAILRAAQLAYEVTTTRPQGEQVDIPPSNVVPYDYQSTLIEAAMAKFETRDSVALWRSVQACVAGDTRIGVNRAGKSFTIPIADIVHRFHGGVVSGRVWDPTIPTYVRGRDANGSVRLIRVLDAVSTGDREVRRLITVGGLSIEATDDHLFLTRHGWKPLKALRSGVEIAVEGQVDVDPPGRVHRKYVQGLDGHPYAARQFDNAMTVLRHRLVMESALNRLDFDEYIARLRSGDVDGLYFIPPEYSVHHIDENGRNNDLSNLALMTAAAHRSWPGRTQWRNVNARTIWDEVRDVGDARTTATYDLVLDDPHCYLANRIVVHNSGKTTAALILATRMGVNTIVVISNSVLMRQWCTRIRDELGFTPGVVGGGKYDVSPPIVVAMQQSLKNMPTHDVDRFGLVIGDEIQLFAADTFQSSIDRFPARYRLGVSGDERRADRKECLIYDQFGPVTAEVKADELVAAGRIHEVEVRVIPTDVRFDWWQEILDLKSTDPNETEEQLIARRTKMKIRSADRLAEDLGGSAERNAAIVQVVSESVAQVGSAIVLAGRREHCHVLDSAISAIGLRSGLLIGGTDYREEFGRTLRGFVAGEIQVAVGTYQAIGVGFDLPAVARGICASPVANAAGGAMQWRQYRGRFARSAKGKTDAAVYYVWDANIFGLKPLQNLIRWNARVVVRDGDDWIPAKQWIERNQADGKATKRHADPKQRSIPGFDSDPDDGGRTTNSRRRRTDVDARPGLGATAGGRSCGEGTGDADRGQPDASGGGRLGDTTGRTGGRRKRSEVGVGR